MSRKRTNRQVNLGPNQGMRTCTVSQRTTGYLPRASTTGYGKYRASPGDLITWCEEDNGPTMHTGRVIGMVDAPAMRTVDHRFDAGPIKDWLIVMRLSAELTYAHPVWVDPKMVTKCIECPKGNLLAFLFSDDFHTMKVEDLMYLSGYGSLSESYIDNWKRRLDERNERLTRKAEEGF